MRCCNRKKDEVPSRYIGDRNALAVFFARSVLGHSCRAGECRPAYGAEIEMHHQMIRHTQRGCDLSRPLYLHSMSLPVGDREEEELVTFLLGQRRRDGG